jgi:hypothetical protein
LRAEGFFCSLRVLYGGLRIRKLRFSIQKIDEKFYRCKFFSSIFRHQKLFKTLGSELDPDLGPYPYPELGKMLDPYPVPEFIDPVFKKTSPKRSFSVIQNERFGLVFAKTGSIILGTD